jgi:hypothetical protein
MTGSIIFLCACTLVFLRPTLGYVLGGIAAVVALPWFVLTESSSGLPSVWTYLNGPYDFGINYRPYAAEKILSVALIAAAVTCSLVRLLPSGLLLRNSPLSYRTWPTIAVAVLVLAVWLHHSAQPWMLPGIVDAVSPDLGILHVEKRGLQFHETSVFSTRNGRFSVSQNDRRLLQYRFQSRWTVGSMPPIILDRANALANSTALRNLRTAPPIALRSWNAEGWYVVLGNRNSPLLAFTTEYGTNPPQEVKDMLAQIEKLPGAQESSTFPGRVPGILLRPCGRAGVYLLERTLSRDAKWNHSVPLSPVTRLLPPNLPRSQQIPANPPSASAHARYPNGHVSYTNHQPRQFPTFHRSSHRSRQAAFVAQRLAPRPDRRFPRPRLRRPSRL